MNDKKPTDKEIIKALDESELFLRNRVKDGQPIKLSEYDVRKLRNISQTCAKAYDEIDQLQTENENLKVENQSLRSAANSLKMHYEEARVKIERLNAENMLTISERNAFRTSFYNVLKQLKTAKAEAYKEFAERLKEKSGKVEMVCSGALVQRDYTISEKTLDNLIKEMVGESNSDE